MNGLKRTKLQNVLEINGIRDRYNPIYYNAYNHNKPQCVKLLLDAIR